MAVDEQVAVLYAGTRGYLDAIRSIKIAHFQTGLLAKLKPSYPQFLDGIRTEKALDARPWKAQLKEALDSFSPRPSPEIGSGTVRSLGHGQLEGDAQPHRQRQVDPEDHQSAADGCGRESCADRRRTPPSARGPMLSAWRAVIANLAAPRSPGRARRKLLVGHGAAIRSQLIVVATADRGLAGGFNSGIAKAARERISARLISPSGKDGQDHLAVGRKGRDAAAPPYGDRIVETYDLSATPTVWPSTWSSRSPTRSSALYDGRRRRTW